jgi:tight adherence protein B
MTTGALLLGLAGVLIAAGLVSLTCAFRARPDTAPPVRTPWRQRIRVTRLHLLAAAAGVLVLLITGWPVAAIGIALGVWFVPSVLGGQAVSRAEIARTEAIATWTRRLADLLASGAVGSLDAALRRSVSACPAPIATEVTALVTRMGPRGIERALRTFADEVDNRAAEKVAGALILRARHGGRGLAEVLSGLAADLDERVRMVREIEAERATPRSNTRTIVLLTAVLIVGEIVFARGFLSPYSTLLGEVALVVVIAVFGMALRWLRKLSEPVKQPKILVNPPGLREGAS